MNEVILENHEAIGKKYNKLLVLKVIRRNKRTIALVRCDCGVEKETNLYVVQNNITVSCGCYNRALHAKRAPTLKPDNKTHGHSLNYKRTVEYKCWQHIKARCYNPNTESYKYYGARGIKVCDRWLQSFQNFIDDMGEKPEPKRSYSIDRINNDGDYEPGNCRWATALQQNNNTRQCKNKC